MKNNLSVIIVTALSANFAPGMRLGLNEEQAAKREHLLDPTEEAGVFVVKHPVQFKRGEVLEADLELLSKTTLAEVNLDDAPIEVRDAAAQLPGAKARGRKPRTGGGKQAAKKDDDGGQGDTK